MKKTLFKLAMLLPSPFRWSQEFTPLYRGLIPNNLPHLPDKEKVIRLDRSEIHLSNVSKPGYASFIPENGNQRKPAVIICPGGGYRILAATAEGTDVAKLLQQRGIAAFVLKYRLPDDRYQVNKTFAPLQDAQEMIKTIRLHAKEWGIDPGKVGIMGFSAGGHLAATLSTHFAAALVDNQQHISLRPDFSILLYPVISAREAIRHIGSQERLLGKKPDPAMVNFFSNELYVDSNTPPAFIVHAEDDTTVPVQNSLLYYQQLQTEKVRGNALHLFPSGGHGFGLHIKDGKVQWPELCFQWMRESSWL